jgi:hypothetical protein
LIEGDQGALEIRKGIAALNTALEDQKGRESVDEYELAKIIEVQMSKMGEQLCQKLNESIGDILAKSTDSSDNHQPSRDEKLDALLVMMKGIQEKIASFTDDFKSFNDISLNHYSDVSKQKNVMPTSFMLLPDISVALNSKASSISKMINYGKRLKDNIVKLAWNKVKVVFFCPVTLQMVECGPYVLVSATEGLKRAAVALKWGHFLVK